MTSPLDFTEDEWNTLLDVPYAAGVYIVLSDPNLMGIPKEAIAMARAVGEVSDDTGVGDELIARLSAEIAERDDSDLVGDESAEDAMIRLRGVVAAGAAIVGRNCTDAVALAYKRWIVDVARATAEASKEHSFLGIGGARVSDKEQAALDELRDALGI